MSRSRDAAASRTREWDVSSRSPAASSLNDLTTSRVGSGERVVCDPQLVIRAQSLPCGVEHSGGGRSAEDQGDDGAEPRALLLGNSDGASARGDTVALGVRDVPGAESGADDPTDDRNDPLVDDVLAEPHALVDDGSDATVVGVLNDGNDLLAIEVAELTTGLAGDIGSVPDDHLLVLPELGRVILKTTQFLLPLAAEAHDALLSIGVRVPHLATPCWIGP